MTTLTRGAFASLMGRLPAGAIHWASSRRLQDQGAEQGAHPAYPRLAQRRLRLGEQSVDLAALGVLATPRTLTQQRRDAVARRAHRGSVGQAAGGDAVRMADAAAVERAAVVREAEPQVEVFAVNERFIETADLAEYALAQYHARGREEIAVQEAARQFALRDETPGVGERRAREAAGGELVGDHRGLQQLAVRIDLLEVREGEPRLRMLLERSHARGQLVGLEEVVRIQQRDVRRTRVEDADVAGARRAAARMLAQHADACIADGLSDVDRSVGRAIVDDQDLKLTQLGRQH